MTNLTLEEKLTDLLTQVQEAVDSYWEETPIAHLDESPEDIHLRLLSLQRVRSYLSGVVSTLIRSQGVANLDLLKAKNDLKAVEVSALTFTRFKDFESARIQDARLSTETLDQIILTNQAEINLSMVTTALNYVREHLREFDRLVHDTNTRIKILLSPQTQ